MGKKESARRTGHLHNKQTAIPTNWSIPPVAISHSSHLSTPTYPNNKSARTPITHSPFLPKRDNSNETHHILRYNDCQDKAFLSIGTRDVFLSNEPCKFMKILLLQVQTIIWGIILSKGKA
jgi:hypothetical protein